MGSTCASVHVLWRGNNGDAAKAISRAYTKLGWERAKKAPAEGGKHVILLARAGESYVSIYDSTNADLDSGELKDAALAASKLPEPSDPRVVDLATIDQDELWEAHRLVDKTGEVLKQEQIALGGLGMDDATREKQRALPYLSSFDTPRMPRRPRPGGEPRVRRR